MPTRHDCPVILPDSLVAGEFANAFRILPEGGPDVILDFCVYSDQEDVARVVHRIRLNKVFLPDVRAILRESLQEVSV